MSTQRRSFCRPHLLRSACGRVVVWEIHSREVPLLLGSRNAAVVALSPPSLAPHSAASPRSLSHGRLI